jgi:hypothetical protein
MGKRKEREAKVEPEPNPVYKEPEANAGPASKYLKRTT